MAIETRDFKELNLSIAAAVKADLASLQAAIDALPEELPPDANIATNPKKLAKKLRVDVRRLYGNGIAKSPGHRRRFLQSLQRTLEDDFAKLGLKLKRNYLDFLGAAVQFDDSVRASASAPSMTLDEVAADLLERALSRDQFLNRLPRLRVPCVLISTSQGRRDTPDAGRVALRFVRERTHNLLVVLGEFGAGKSELLRMAADDAAQAGKIPLLMTYADMASWLDGRDAADAIAGYLQSISVSAADEFRDSLDSRPHDVLLLIDAFDEANLSVDATDPGPNLSRLSSLFAAGCKVAVATRRSLSATPDEFVSQIGSAKRRAELGIQSFQIVEMKACGLEEVERALLELPPDQAEVMRDYLTSSQHIQMDRVRRPLVLQMLLDSPADTFSPSEPFSIYGLYDIYADIVLDRERQRTASLIPTPSKRRMLQHIASTMFASQVRRSEARISRDDLHHVVSTEVARPENTLWAERGNLAGHSWIMDFRASAGLVVPTGPRPDPTSSFEFVHHSLYEFFLSQHFVAEFDRECRFGLQDDRHSVRAFDSLLPYFLRAEFREHEDELERLVVDPTTSNLDRLLGFFLLEDDPGVLDLLRRALDFNYDAFLHDAEKRFDSFFMKKLVRFQLVLLDDGIGRALAYVYDARRREQDQDLDIEVHTFAAGQRPTEFLLGRTRNPRLATALPIWVYRLGLFGDPSALPRLAELSEQEPDPMFRALVSEAITSIKRRSPRRRST